MKAGVLAGLLLGAWAAVAQEDALQAIEARGRLIVPVTINEDGPFSFLLDTCLGNPVITPQTAQYLNLPFEGSEVVRAAAFGCAAIPPHEERLAVEDLGVLSRQLGVELAGLLPAQRPGFEAHLTFEPPRVWWTPLENPGPETAETPEILGGPEQAGTQSLKVDAEGAPCVPVLLEGKHLRMLRLDTASSDMLALSAADLEAVGALKSGMARLSPEGRLEKSPRGMPQPGARVRLGALQFGGLRIEGVVCRVLAENEPGQVGTGLLRHFRVGLAFEAGRVRLEPLHTGPLTAAPLSGFGIALDLFEAGAWTIRVVKDSPAHDAGLRTGDVLLRVGEVALDAAGQVPGAYARELERQLSAPPGTTVEIRARGKEDRTVTLTSVTMF